MGLINTNRNVEKTRQQNVDKDIEPWKTEIQANSSDPLEVYQRVVVTVSAMFGFTNFQLFCLPQRERVLVFFGGLPGTTKRPATGKRANSTCLTARGRSTRGQVPWKVRGIRRDLSLCISIPNQNQPTAEVKSYRYVTHLSSKDYTNFIQFYAFLYVANWWFGYYLLFGYRKIWKQVPVSPHSFTMWSTFTMSPSIWIWLTIIDWRELDNCIFC